MREQEILPVQSPTARELSEGEEIIATLAGAINEPPKQERRENSWIRPGIWGAIGERRSKANAGVRTRQERRKLTRKVKRLLQEDRIELVRRAGEAITILRVEGKEEEEWALANG